MTGSFKEVPRASGVTRRQFGSTVGASAFALTWLPSGTKASDLLQLNPLTLEESLQSALRTIGSTTCKDAADDLARRATNSPNVTLHLRRAGLSAYGAGLFANSLAFLSSQERARLHSFSLSYNEIGDRGAITLAGALPETLNELGLVGCSIADKGADALLQWAAGAQGLGMICIEGNPMSKTMRDRFVQLRRSSPGLAVFV